jgi:phosphatidate cytidylyltransferase
MKQRTITGIILALVLIPAFVIGDLFLNIVLMLLTLGATYELLKMFSEKNDISKGVKLLFIGLAGLLYHTIRSYYDAPLVFKLDWVFMMIVLIVFVASFLLVLLPKYSVDNFGQVLVSVFYPALGFGAIYGIRSASIYNLGFLFLVTICTDIFAYFVGVKFGKHRLAEHISPKKSVEGSIGGTTIALAITLLYVWLFNIEQIGTIEINVFTSIFLIILISVMGQAGDLVASKMKRDYGIKDFSNLFPGHGGILDRFDSVLFAGMVLMLLSEFLGVLS